MLTSTKKTAADLSQEFNKQQEKLKESFVAKMTKIITKQKAKASACKDAIKVLEDEKGQATAEISNATQQLKRIQNS